jgi:hypothetical protein
MKTAMIVCWVGAGTCFHMSRELKRDSVRRGDPDHARRLEIGDFLVARVEQQMRDPRIVGCFSSSAAICRRISSRPRDSSSGF